MSEIFLSYSSDEKTRAALFAQRLEDHGWSVWWDQEIVVGTDWARSIKAQLDEARGVVVLWSQLSVASDWVMKEARFAERKGILIPVLIDDVELPFEFESYQVANLVGWDGGPSADFDRFVEGIEARVPRASASAGDADQADGATRNTPSDRALTEGASEREQALVLAAFRSFCTFLNGVVRELSARPWTRADGPDAGGDDPRAVARVERIQDSLLDRLVRLEGDVRRGVNASGMAAFSDAKYAMVALADELILQEDWDGRAAWDDDPLEMKIFQTRDGSEEVFRRIENLLDGRPHEHGQMEYLYLSLLALGFRGKYRGSTGDDPIRRLRLALLHSGAAGQLPLSGKAEPLFPQPTRYTLTTAEELIPAVRPWAAVLLAVIALYVVVSHLLWTDTISGLVR